MDLLTCFCYQKCWVLWVRITPAFLRGVRRVPSRSQSCAGHCSSTLSVGQITALKETGEGILEALVLLGRDSGILFLGFSELVWEA